MLRRNHSAAARPMTRHVPAALLAAIMCGFTKARLVLIMQCKDAARSLLLVVR